MIADLKNSIIFLHGLSGSGKGEIQRQITERYTSNGYEVIYGSSGDLLRAGFSDPYIRTRLLSGYYFDTLEPIIPGLKAVLKDFITKWIAKDGKVALILDGVIRRTDFVNSEGKQILPQIEQVANCLNDTILALAEENQSILKDFPEYGRQENEKGRIAQVTEVLKAATHIIADVRPQDAEAQMKARAVKEIQSIKRQLLELLNQGSLPESLARDIEAKIMRVEGIVSGDFLQSKDEIVYNPDLPEGERTKPINVDLNIALNEAKNELARIAGVEGESTTLASICKKFGVDTTIREDDITPLGRTSRVNNFIKQTREGDLTVYEPGFAALALTKDLGFKLTPDISFESTSHNCYVIRNGQSRGVTLEDFRVKSRTLARELFAQTEGERLLTREGQEGFRHGKER